MFNLQTIQLANILAPLPGKATKKNSKSINGFFVEITGV